MPVPDSGTPAAIGFAEAAGLPFDLGIIRNHYVGRTFIEPTDAIRHMGVRLKHNANRDVLAGKRVVLVDDSIVRGTTSLKIVQMIREAGAERSAHAHRQPADDALLLLRRRHAGEVEADRLAHVGRGDGATSSRSTASPSCRSTASTAPSARPRATATRRNSATPASPATIRPASPTARSATTTSASFRCLAEAG